MIDLPVPPGLPIPSARLLRHHDVHRPDCRCETCEPYRPDLPEPLAQPRIGELMILGILAGNAIAFAIDPHGSVQALLDVARSFAS